METMSSVTLQIVPLRNCWTVHVDEEEKRFEPKSPFVNDNEEKSKGIVLDNKIVQRRQMTIAESLNPLLASMKMFGLYFNLRSKDLRDDRKAKAWKVKTYLVYAVSIVILLWINVNRMCLAFTYEDEFGLMLFQKLVAIAWFIQTTSILLANGLLRSVSLKWPVLC